MGERIIEREEGGERMGGILNEKNYILRIRNNKNNLKEKISMIR